ncbi:hypothetical protein D3C81_1919040 [compost metagenome]
MRECSDSAWARGSRSSAKACRCVSSEGLKGSGFMAGSLRAERALHFMRRKAVGVDDGWAWTEGSINSRMRARARDNRDITVPSGIPSTRATSA